ncbi:MAG: hypothetical protein IPP45_19465 [Sphingomonadales bacterium]|nr:hypothetical protein [Sphingomonadales bacterium]
MISRKTLFGLAGGFASAFAAPARLGAGEAAGNAADAASNATAAVTKQHPRLRLPSPTADMVSKGDTAGC